MSAPVDHGWSWCVALAVMFNNVVMMGLTNVSGLIFNDMIEYFHTSASMAALVLGFRAAFFSIFVVIGTGILNEFIHSRLIVIGGAICATIGFATMFGATRAEHMFVYGILVGTGHSCIHGPGLIMVGKYFDRRISFGNGLAMSGASLGTLVFPFLMSFLLEEFKFPGAMLLCGGLCLNCCVAGMLMRPTEFYKRGLGYDVAKEERDDLRDYEIEVNKFDKNLAQSPKQSLETGRKVELGGTEPNDEHKEVKSEPYNFFFSKRTGDTKKALINFKLFKQPVFIVYIIAAPIYLVMLRLSQIFLPALAKEDGRTQSEITILLSLFGVTDFIGRLFFGYLGDTGRFDRTKIFITTMTIIGVLSCLVKFFSGFWLLLVYHCLCGFLTSAFGALMPVTLVDLFGRENQSRSFSVMMLANGVIQIGTASALGYIKDTTGSYIGSFALLGALTLTSSALFVFVVLPLTKRRNKNTESNNTRPIYVCDSQDSVMLTDVTKDHKIIG